ncbi:hypothetical protein [Chryseosolibacter indicus]|uniref:Anti-sigma factor n=1 Tax=Chryseosolibacter indicus TaxID=2782351 RepID=A0ABS5W2R1_9BACT|nr:hypothetical protein [Chryseosolibacter indicus]MBT1706546.1 hypothetical protein [Chryseosolibacter indicus]
MNDELERFVKENRDAFDDKEPSEKIWNEVSRSIKTGKKTTLWNSVVIWRAAAMLFMALSVYLLIPKTNNITKQREATLNEFADVEQFYIAQISEKTALIQELHKTEGLNGFTHDFKQLEAMYMVLKEEMKRSPNQKVKDALVLNLLVRIDLLNQQLHHLENDDHTTQEDTDNGKSKPSKNV